MSTQRLMAVLIAVTLGAAPGPARADVFVNEFHYDNNSTDTGEAIEVVATANEDLTQYSIVLYNGNGGASYDSDILPAGSNVTCGSIVKLAVLNYPANGIQNGNPDAIALIGPGSTVVQFIGYGGTFAATNGPANGMTSTNIGVTESTTSPVGNSLQLGGTGATYANFTWNGSAAHTFGACNTGQIFSLGPPVNTLPSITSTVPTHNGSVVPGTQSFTVNFSESVTAQDSAFSMQCSVAGSVPLTLPAGKHLAQATDRPGRMLPARLAAPMIGHGKAFATGSSITLTTTANLQDGETCIFTIDADGIADSENAHPAADTVVSFSVAPTPNVLPTVVSSTPANNTIGVAPAADFRIVFSEMVSADTEAFALQCSLSGMIAPLSSYKVLETTPSGGRVMTLSSMTVLQAGESCNLTVFAAGVVDDDDDAMAQDHAIHFTVAGNPLAYYNQVNTSSAEQLRCSLHLTIRGHTVYPYTAGTTDTWDILNIADEDPNNPANILDVYKNASYTKIPGGTGSYNREHTWPNSLGFSFETLGGLPYAPYTDTHMLYASDSSYNSSRSNSPYGTCLQSNGCNEKITLANNGMGGGSGTYPGNSNWVGNDTWQTWPGRKGDVARAILYMAIRYEGGTHPTTGQVEPDLELTDNRALIVTTTSSPAYMGFLSDLLQWHLDDPPNANELGRNEVIYSFQGNRNPFIDHPEWASQALFNSSKPASCQLSN